MDKVKRLVKTHDQKITAGVLLYLVVLAFMPLFAKSYTVFLFTKILLWALVCMGYILLTGFGGMGSFCVVTFYGLMAYAVAVCIKRFAMPYGIGVLIALGVCTVVAFLYSIVAIKTKGRYFLMMSVAFINLVYLTVYQWTTLTGGGNGMNALPSPTIFGLSISKQTTVFYFVYILVFVSYLLIKLITNSPFGIAIMGSRDNAVKMESLGFNVKLLRLALMMIAAFFAFIGGICHCVLYTNVAPDNVGLSTSIIIVFMCLVGCVKKVEGAFVGTILYVLLQNRISEFTDRYNMIIGALLILAVLFLPKGILGYSMEDIRANIRKLKEKRRVKAEEKQEKNMTKK